MAQDNGQLDTDGYYGDDDTDSEEIDLSFLDEKDDEEKKEDDSASGTTGAAPGAGGKDSK